MDNQTRNELNRKKHADEQAAIIRLRNAQIAALQEEKGRLQRALQERPEVQENPRPLTADDITDEMIERAKRRFEELDGALVYTKSNWVFQQVLTAALTPPPPRPEGAEEIEVLLFDAGVDENRAEVADYLAARLTDPTRKEA